MQMNYDEISNCMRELNSEMNSEINNLKQKARELELLNNFLMEQLEADREIAKILKGEV